MAQFSDKYLEELKREPGYNYTRWGDKEEIIESGTLVRHEPFLPQGGEKEHFCLVERPELEGSDKFAERGISYGLTCGRWGYPYQVSIPTRKEIMQNTFHRGGKTIQPVPVVEDSNVVPEHLREAVGRSVWWEEGLPLAPNTKKYIKEEEPMAPSDNTHQSQLQEAILAGKGRKPLRKGKPQPLKTVKTFGGPLAVINQKFKTKQEAQEFQSKFTGDFATDTLVFENAHSKNTWWIGVPEKFLEKGGAGARKRGKKAPTSNVPEEGIVIRRDFPVNWLPEHQRIKKTDEYGAPLERTQILRDSKGDLYTIDRMRGYLLDLDGINEDGSWRQEGNRTVNLDPSSPEYDQGNEYFRHSIEGKYLVGDIRKLNEPGGETVAKEDFNIAEHSSAIENYIKDRQHEWSHLSDTDAYGQIMNEITDDLDIVLPMEKEGNDWFRGLDFYKALDKIQEEVLTQVQRQASAIARETVAKEEKPEEYSDLTGEPKRTENPTVLEGQAGFALGSSRDMNPYEKALKEMSGEEPYDDERHAFLKKHALQWDTGYHMAEAEDRRQADAHLSSPGRPQPGKVYRLTGGPDEPNIASGDSWAESEVPKEWKLSEKEFDKLIKHLEANPTIDYVSDIVQVLELDLPGMPGDEVRKRAETQLEHEIAVAHQSAYNPWDSESQTFSEDYSGPPLPHQHRLNDGPSFEDHVDMAIKDGLDDTEAYIAALTLKRMDENGETALKAFFEASEDQNIHGHSTDHIERRKKIADHLEMTHGTINLQDMAQELYNPSEAASYVKPQKEEAEFTVDTKDARSVSPAVTAKAIKKELKARYPDTKFSVTSSRFSGGSSVDVRYDGGPAESEVNEILDQYQGGRFDSMIDLQTQAYSWLLPDGSAVLAKIVGTEGSMGTIPNYDVPKPHPDAELVHFQPGYISARRSEPIHSPRDPSTLPPGETMGLGEIGDFIVQQGVKHNPDVYTNEWGEPWTVKRTEDRFKDFWDEAMFEKDEDGKYRADQVAGIIEYNLGLPLEKMERANVKDPTPATSGTPTQGINLDEFASEIHHDLQEYASDKGFEWDQLDDQDRADKIAGLVDLYGEEVLTMGETGWGGFLSPLIEKHKDDDNKVWLAVEEQIIDILDDPTGRWQKLDERRQAMYEKLGPQVKRLQEEGKAVPVELVNVNAQLFPGNKYLRESVIHKAEEMFEEYEGLFRTGYDTSPRTQAIVEKHQMEILKFMEALPKEYPDQFMPWDNLSKEEFEKQRNDAVDWMEDGPSPKLAKFLSDEQEAIYDAYKGKDESFYENPTLNDEYHDEIGKFWDSIQGAVNRVFEPKKVGVDEPPRPTPDSPEMYGLFDDTDVHGGVMTTERFFEIIRDSLPEQKIEKYRLQEDGTWQDEGSIDILEGHQIARKAIYPQLPKDLSPEDLRRVEDTIFKAVTKAYEDSPRGYEKELEKFVNVNLDFLSPEQLSDAEYLNQQRIPGFSPGFEKTVEFISKNPVLNEYFKNLDFDDPSQNNYELPFYLDEELERVIGQVNDAFNKGYAKRFGALADRKQQEELTPKLREQALIRMDLEGRIPEWWASSTPSGAVSGMNFMASLLSDENRKIVEEGYDSYIETKKRWYMDPLVLEGKTAPMTLIGKDIADVKLANEKIEQAFEVLETLSLAAQKRPEEYPYRDEKFSYKEQPYEVVGYDDGDEMNVVKNLKTGKMFKLTSDQISAIMLADSLSMTALSDSPVTNARPSSRLPKPRKKAKATPKKLKTTRGRKMGKIKNYKDLVTGKVFSRRGKGPKPTSKRFTAVK